MAYTTLIDPVQLQREYTAPRWVVFDCRFDLADKARDACRGGAHR